MATIAHGVRGMLLVLVLLASGKSLSDDSLDANNKEILVTAAILDIDAINSAEQNFTVNLFIKLRWTAMELANTKNESVRYDLLEVDAPRVMLINRQRSWSSTLNVIDVSPSGEVLYSGHVWGDFSQPLDLQKFPFDKHVLEIPVIALDSSGKPLPLRSDPEDESIIATRLSVADWSVSDFRVRSGEVQLTQGKFVPGYVLSVQAERNYFHYLIKFIIPLILISAMSWVVFWIDPSEMATQLTVAMTAVLTLIAYHIALTSKLPDIPYLTRMDLFLFGSTLLVFAALIVVVLSSRLSYSGQQQRAHKVDRFSRSLFPLFYSLMAIIALRW